MQAKRLRGTNVYINEHFTKKNGFKIELFGLKKQDGSEVD